MAQGINLESGILKRADDDVLAGEYLTLAISLKFQMIEAKFATVGNRLRSGKGGRECLRGFKEKVTFPGPFWRSPQNRYHIAIHENDSHTVKQNKMVPYRIQIESIVLESRTTMWI